MTNNIAIGNLLSEVDYEKIIFKELGDFSTIEIIMMALDINRYNLIEDCDDVADKFIKLFMELKIFIKELKQLVLIDDLQNSQKKEIKDLMYDNYISVRELTDLIYEYVNNYAITKDYVDKLDEKIEEIDPDLFFISIILLD